MHINIIQHIRKVVDLSDGEVEVFNQYVETHQFKKKEFLNLEGNVCKKLYFVEKGCLRMYFINKKGVEQITQFALDGWWISDYQSFLNITSSNYFIQTIEVSTIVSIDNQNLDKLLIEIPHLEKYFK